MRQAHKLLLAAAAPLSLPAAAAVTVVGNSDARLCYEAAASKLTPGRQAVGRCTEALHGTALTAYETVATLVNRGILKARLGDPAGAIADYDAAIARDADQAEAYLNKGMALLRLEDNGEALRQFTAALDKKTRKPAFAYYGRGIAHELSGDVRRAYQDYRQASLIDPDWAQPRAELQRFTVRAR